MVLFFLYNVTKVVKVYELKDVYSQCNLGCVSSLVDVQLHQLCHDTKRAGARHGETNGTNRLPAQA